MSWKPISEAPKDRPIMLLTSDWGAVEGFWDADVLNFYANNGGASSNPGEKGDWVSDWAWCTNGDGERDRRLYCGQTPHAWAELPERDSLAAVKRFHASEGWGGV